MAGQQSPSPPSSMKLERPPCVQLSTCTPPHISESSCESHVLASRTPKSSSPVRHSRPHGRNSLRLAWAESSNFRNTLTVPHGGLMHRGLSGDLFTLLRFICLLTFMQYYFRSMPPKTMNYFVLGYL